MSFYLKTITSSIKGDIQRLLLKYIEQRAQCSNQLVGQFLDEQGAKSTQYGTYGISMFLTLFPDSKDKKIIDLRKQCLDYLISLCQKANEEIDYDRISETKLNEDIYELRNVVPKICYAYKALSTILDERANAHRFTLKNRLLISQSQNGGWKFIIDGNEDDSVFATALVIRTLSLEQDVDTKVILSKALEYLEKEINDGEDLNLYRKLYVLNTVFILLSQQIDYEAPIQLSDIERSIKKTISIIYSTSKKNPTLFSNPLNIDYSDNRAKRVRYYRHSCDLILIEAFSLLSGNAWYYFNNKKVELIFKNITDLISAPQRDTFTYDASGHRAAFGYYTELYHCICQIEQRKKSSSMISNWFQHIFGSYLSWRLLGIDWIPEVILFIQGVIVFGIFFIFLRNPHPAPNQSIFGNEIITKIYVGALISFILKLLVDICLKIYNDRYNFRK